MTFNFHTTISGIRFGLSIAQVLWLSMKSYCINIIHEFKLFGLISCNRTRGMRLNPDIFICEAMIRLP